MRQTGVSPRSRELTNVQGDFHIASVSGLGCGTVIASLLRAASESGQLSDVRTTLRDDDRQWYEFRYCLHDGDSGQSVVVATNQQHLVVEGELWGTPALPASTPFRDVERLRSYLRYVDCIETISSPNMSVAGELTKVCLGFSGCAPLLLTRRL